MKISLPKFIPERYHSVVKRVISMVLILLGLFVVVNYQYLYQQIKYRVNPPNPTPIQTVLEHGEPNLLQIPSLGITAPIQYVTEANEGAYQKALQEGVVLYPGTALPGEFGNTYIFGHSSDFAFSKGKYKTVFALLPQIKNGAEIQVSNAGGEVFTYVVRDQFVAEKDDLHLLEQGDRTQKQLTLQTSYPLGTALKRYIVIALLKQ